MIESKWCSENWKNWVDVVYERSPRITTENNYFDKALKITYIYCPCIILAEHITRCIENSMEIISCKLFHHSRIVKHFAFILNLIHKHQNIEKYKNNWSKIEKINKKIERATVVCSVALMYLQKVDWKWPYYGAHCTCVLP